MLQDNVVISSDADWLLEVIARSMIVTGEQAHVSAHFRSCSKGIQMAYDTWEQAFLQTASIVGTDSAKDSILKKEKLCELGGTIDIDLACSQLKAARDAHRNKTQVAQLVNKNVGSIAGDTALPFVDTRLKGRRMIELARELGYKGEDAHVYGTQYNHMEPEFRAIGCNITYHDLKAATKGVADVEWGDIFTANAPFIFDDTLVTTAPPTKGKLSQVYTADHAKLAHFMTLRKAKLIISKVDLDHFRKPDQINELIRIVENLNDPTFKHVQLVKLGKLHNTEAFFVFSNMGTDRFPEKVEGEKPKSVIRGDLAQCALCMSISNEVIQRSQVYGMRAKRNDKTNGTLSRMWRLLISALPFYWFWYIPNVAKGVGDTKMEGGSYSLTTYVPDAELLGASSFNFKYDAGKLSDF